MSIANLLSSNIKAWQNFNVDSINSENPIGITPSSFTGAFPTSMNSITTTTFLGTVTFTSAIPAIPSASRISFKMDNENINTASAIFLTNNLNGQPTNNVLNVGVEDIEDGSTTIYINNTSGVSYTPTSMKINFIIIGTFE